MKVVFGISLLVCLQLMGSALQQLFSLSVPGPVLGLLMLLVLLLLLGERLLVIVEPVASWLVQNLSLLFIPITVSVIFHANQYRQDGWALLLVVSVGTWLAMIATAWVGKRLLRLN